MSSSKQSGLLGHSMVQLFLIALEVGQGCVFIRVFTPQGDRHNVVYGCILLPTGPVAEAANALISLIENLDIHMLHPGPSEFCPSLVVCAVSMSPHHLWVGLSISFVPLLFLFRIGSIPGFPDGPPVLTIGSITSTIFGPDDISLGQPPGPDTGLTARLQALSFAPAKGLSRQHLATARAMLVSRGDCGILRLRHGSTLLPSAAVFRGGQGSHLWPPCRPSSHTSTPHTSPKITPTPMRRCA